MLCQKLRCIKAFNSQFYYLRTLYVQIHLLAKINCNSQIDNVALSLLLVDVQTVAKNFSCSMCTFPGEAEKGMLCLVLAVMLQASGLYTVCIVSCFSHFVLFVSEFAVLKWPPKVVLKFCPVFLSTRRMLYTIQRIHLC